MTSLDKLNVSQLSPHEAFFSTLKNENISAEDYQLCQREWENNDMKTIKESLTWYNKDVEPMLEAIDKIFQFNQNKRIYMFKYGIMFQDLPDYFTVPDEKNKVLLDHHLPSLPRERQDLHTTCRVHRSKALSVDLWCRRQCSVPLEYYAEDAYRTFRPTEDRRRVQETSPKTL